MEPSQTTSDSHFGYTLATPGERLGAVIIEAIILILPFIFLFIIINLLMPAGKSFSVEDFSAPSMRNMISSAVGGAIFGAIFYPFFSGNLGHAILKLKVISADDGRDFNKSWDGAKREFLKSLLGNLVIPVIWLLWDKDRQNLYDKITRTYVVKKKQLIL